MLSLLVPLLVLAQAPAAVTVPESTTSESAPGPTRFRAAIELSVMTFPSGTTGGSNDLFATVLPLIGFDGGEDFGFEIGAPLRLRLFDDPPEQRGEDIGGILRGRDWDERSDYGQLLRELRIGRDASFLQVRAGPLDGVTLGYGHLVNRYNNRLNPDYHPAGAQLSLQLPVARAELIVSDVLAARLFALEVAIDIGRVFSANADNFDRFRLAVSAAHDQGQAGYLAPALSMLHFDLSAAIFRSETTQAHAVGGVGMRLAGDDSGFGAVLGLMVDSKVGESPLGARLEVRKQSGGFRHGMFGADYELARFASVGLNSVPVAGQALPDSFSVAGEFQLELAPKQTDRPSPLTLSVGAERFFWGRTDADAAVHAALMEGKAVLSVRGIVTGLEVQPRYLLQFENRVRLFPAMYVVGYGGTAFFAEPAGPADLSTPVPMRLARGIYVGAGAGFDFSR